jgi:hydrogenase maturation protein HypF
VRSLLLPHRLDIWTNHAVPPNDGGISLGQAALAAFGQFNEVNPSITGGPTYA